MIVWGAFLGWVWCFTRGWVKAACGRQRFNVLGALHAVTHEVVTVSNTTYITAERVCALLVELAARAGGKAVTVVLDNARYQRCALVQGVAPALGIELLYLPTYRKRVSTASPDKQGCRLFPNRIYLQVFASNPV